MKWLVIALMILLLPITWPISKVLDWLLGTAHGTFFRRTELKELVALHGIKGEENSDPLTRHEIAIIKGVLEMEEKTLKQIMTPIDTAFMISDDMVLTGAVLDVLYAKGYSRIPIIERVSGTTKDHQQSFVMEKGVESDVNSSSSSSNSRASSTSTDTSEDTSDETSSDDEEGVTSPSEGEEEGGQNPDGEDGEARREKKGKKKKKKKGWIMRKLEEGRELTRRRSKGKSRRKDKEKGKEKEKEQAEGGADEPGEKAEDGKTEEAPEAIAPPPPQTAPPVLETEVPRERLRIRGALLVKSLIKVSPRHPPRVSSLEAARVLHFPANSSLFTVMNLLITKSIHMAVVHSLEDPEEVVGIVTLEDIMEEMIQKEIENDRMLSVNALVPPRSPAPPTRSLDVLLNNPIEAPTPAGAGEGGGDGEETHWRNRRRRSGGEVGRRWADFVHVPPRTAASGAADASGATHAGGNLEELDHPIVTSFSLENTRTMKSGARKGSKKKKKSRLWSKDALPSASNERATTEPARVGATSETHLISPATDPTVAKPPLSEKDREARASTALKLIGQEKKLATGQHGIPPSPSSPSASASHGSPSLHPHSPAPPSGQADHEKGQQS